MTLVGAISGMEGLEQALPLAMLSDIAGQVFERLFQGSILLACSVLALALAMWSARLKHDSLRALPLVEAALRSSGALLILACVSLLLAPESFLEIASGGYEAAGILRSLLVETTEPHQAPSEDQLAAGAAVWLMAQGGFGMAVVMVTRMLASGRPRSSDL